MRNTADTKRAIAEVDTFLPKMRELGFCLEKFTDELSTPIIVCESPNVAAETTMRNLLSKPVTV
ncbi:hypothetical protein OOK39_31690 [Streptomyces sp. NBC_00264]|uniref:hypothetical protein n=1 Tax=unclassified Streptomyces TaxID=2593676 RepID=UPI00225786A5|nr:MULTISPECIES: hypothetical protein [unclassified Streptomyces]MCX5163794.1 hypothetical protein [Streptomyces sp. NBC_00305]MCX5222317.1 hypothetical protein [Streptomyces sp. NBC_00264]